MKRWWCSLCPARGREPTGPAAFDALEKHYQNEHMNKERRD